MESHISVEEFAEMFAGYDIEDYIIENDHSFWFLCYDRGNRDRNKRLVNFDSAKPERQQWACLPLS